MALARMAQAECIDLGVVDATHGINFSVPRRSDLAWLELTFLPRTPPTNAVMMQISPEYFEDTLTTQNIPEGVPDGRVWLAMRWLLRTGEGTEYRMAAFDLWRRKPEPPVARPTVIGGTNFMNGESRPVRETRTPVVQGPMEGRTPSQFDSATVQDSTIPMRKANGGLEQAVSDAFRKVTDPLPPLPPAGPPQMQRRSWIEPKPVIEPNTKERDRMLKYFRDGGQKGRITNAALQPNP